MQNNNGGGVWWWWVGEGGHKILRKSMPKWMPKETKIEIQNAPRSCVLDFGSIWDDLRFRRFGGRKKDGVLE